jgi:hypothetical protein
VGRQRGIGRIARSDIRRSRADRFLLVHDTLWVAHSNTGRRPEFLATALACHLAIGPVRAVLTTPALGWPARRNSNPTERLGWWSVARYAFSRHPPGTAYRRARVRRWVGFRVQEQQLQTAHRLLYRGGPGIE